MSFSAMQEWDLSGVGSQRGDVPGAGVGLLPDRAVTLHSAL